MKEEFEFFTPYECSKGISGTPSLPIACPADMLTSSDHLSNTVPDYSLEKWPQAASAANIGAYLHCTPEYVGCSELIGRDAALLQHPRSAIAWSVEGTKGCTFGDVR